jgi:hypothetical protein
MAEKRSEIYEVGPDHMVAFGSIVQHFARHENLMQSVMSMLLQVPMSNIAFLTGGLGYASKRDARLSLLRDIEIAQDRKERIRWFLGELHEFNHHCKRRKRKISRSRPQKNKIIYRTS